jgi:hypothetical protein
MVELNLATLGIIELLKVWFRMATAHIDVVRAIINIYQIKIEILEMISNAKYESAPEPRSRPRITINKVKTSNAPKNIPIVIPNAA